MTSLRFVHAADLHLDSPLTGLARYEGAPVEEVRGATRRALEGLVDLAIAEGAAFVLIAGDLYDGDWRDYHTGLYFNRQAVRLQEAGIRVFLVRGNHDAESRISRHLRLSANVRDLGTAKAEQVVLEDLGVAITGRGYASPKVTEDLASTYPDPIPGLFNIALLHTALDGRPGHEPYAPCTLAGLTERGYDYWALGHVHRREEVSRDPWVVFPGNLQGRHVRETGAKGCTLVTVERARVSEVAHRPVDVVRWAVVTVDAAGAGDPDAVLDRVQSALQAAQAEAQGRPLAARIEVQGACAAHAAVAADEDRWCNQVRQAAAESTGGRTWVEQVRVSTQPLRSPDEDAGGVRFEIAQGLNSSDDDERLLAEVGAELRGLWKRIPPELRRLEGLPAPDRPDSLRATLEEARRMLAARLSGGGEA